VAGIGLADGLRLKEAEFQRFGPDVMLRAAIVRP
jgi:hypothetical protein